MIRAPLEFLLFSDFAVVLAYVHLYTLFMVAPIFNTMVRVEEVVVVVGGYGFFFFFFFLMCVCVCVWWM